VPEHPLVHGLPWDRRGGAIAVGVLPDAAIMLVSIAAATREHPVAERAVEQACEQMPLRRSAPASLGEFPLRLPQPLYFLPRLGFEDPLVNGRVRLVVEVR